jgi:hypothetical protein
MPEKMLKKSCKEIEIECLRVARLAVGCSHPQGVRIGPEAKKGSGPNWGVFGPPDCRRLPKLKLSR